MRIEKINENVLKVTITLNDLEERNIDLGSLNYNSPAAQELFWDMMEKAEEEYGFASGESQLIFEASPENEDGFVVTITKVDADGEFESIQKYIKSKYKNSELKQKKKKSKVCSTLKIYCFNNLDDVCKLTKRITAVYQGESTLFRCRDSYYLLLSGIATGSQSLEIIMSEYSVLVGNPAFFEGYLNEYGEKIISDNAIETLNTYF
ncbi:adaptor protein MecA [Ruminiclostridium cellobioparum]|uniref:Negative regulator of genetic competence, sporulation and motility n=1 Tax=Ruminiclostridium cellobioparum subsp. termitidis CT1112 TaxID=1195236 RepID=S0FPL7_RUMCE|nr:adaptor protein MecA [Ruminiclostridium cellobioparum]EMS74170.1 Negative regulator of genetic competence, sporulation and motility [Ruminiclostridium cellobioparum subsp. termitidis CT1112]